MAERTPGPWHIKAGYDWVIESQDGASVAGVYTPAGQREVRQANARFIAAAPEMLEELEWAHSQLCPHPDWCDANHPVEWPKHNAIRATIAKAKGE